MLKVGCKVLSAYFVIEIEETEAKRAANVDFLHFRLSSKASSTK